MRISLHNTSATYISSYAAAWPVIAAGTQSYIVGGNTASLGAYPKAVLLLDEACCRFESSHRAKITLVSDARSAGKGMIGLVVVARQERWSRRLWQRMGEPGTRPAHLSLKFGWGRASGQAGNWKMGGKEREKCGRHAYGVEMDRLDWFVAVWRCPSGRIGVVKWTARWGTGVGL